VNEALLKLGNIVHDSVHVDNNEARAEGVLFGRNRFLAATAGQQPHRTHLGHSA